MLSCNKKGLAHTNWIVHLEQSWCKKSLVELNRRNPSLSAWSMGMTCFSCSSFALFLSGFIFVIRSFLLTDHFPALSTGLVSIFYLFSHSSCLSLLSISSFCTRKTHRVQHVSHHCKKINKSLTGTHY